MAMSLSFSIGFILSSTLPGLWRKDLSEKDKRRKRKGYQRREEGLGEREEKGWEERRVGGREREHHSLFVLFFKLLLNGNGLW